MSDAERLFASASPGTGDILQLLLDGQARTKADLVHLTGLARSTVSSRVDALLASGLVVPAGEAASTGGRPPSRVTFNRNAGHVIAIDLGASHATVAISDLGGKILQSTSLALDIAAGPDFVLDRAVSEATALLSASTRPDIPVVGVGIGVPGPVVHSTGRPYSPPIMPGWDRFDIPSYVQRTFDVPVLVDNDVNILALGEQKTSYPDTANLIFVKVATGIGAGIITGGALQRGAQGSAGDMGHVKVPYSPTSSHEPGDDSDLEDLASGTAIAAALREQGIDAQNSFDVAQLVQAGNTVAIEAIRQAGRDVGEVLATVVNLLNPSVIVLGGSIARAGEHLLAGVREVVYRRSIPLATQHLAIVQSVAGERAGVSGAAVLVARELLSPANVDAYVASATR